MIENNIAVQVNNISKCYANNNNNKINSLSALMTQNLPWNIATHRRNKKLFPKTSGDLWALKNISFSLKKGDILGIIGHNGAGKSTLLKILSQVVLPTSGEAYMRGSIGSLLETGTGFHPELTGFENIFISGTILGMTKNNIKDKLEEIIEFSEMKDFIHVPVKNYSSGMLAKLGFSVASHLSSDIMIVDEVLSVGDAFFQEKSQNKMLQLIKDHEKTILFVSHSEASVKELCTQAIMLTKGETMDHGKPEDVFITYNNYMKERVL